MNKCKFCKHAHDLNNGTYECKRYPPIVDSNRPYVEFPLVDGRNWCGEFKQSTDCCCICGVMRSERPLTMRMNKLGDGRNFMTYEDGGDQRIFEIPKDHITLLCDKCKGKVLHTIEE